MARIKQLSYHEAQKIAAGEVVERPANVVKELVENSLDAGSNSISIYIEDAGKKLIRIIDDGSGMDKEDAYMSIKHHATSKINSVNDLASISTFGFRGEALSTISAVSKVTLTTKEEVGTAGISLTIYDSAVQKESLTASNKGTDISVEELFYNVPVRKKFLKTKETEWRAIVQLFHAFCFSYLSVHFKLYHEGKLVYNCPATTELTTRLSQLFDANLVRNMLIFNQAHERMRISISGALSNSHYTRYDRNHIFLFVNNRWIKNHKLVQAFIKGYKNSLQPNVYPVGFIFITIDPAYVDINIHPRKEEVQFLHPKIVEEYLKDAVEARLELHAIEKLGAAPQAVHKFSAVTSGQQTTITLEPLRISYNLQENTGSARQSVQESSDFLNMLQENFGPSETTMHQQASIPTNIKEAAASAEPQDTNYTLLGQALKTYIVIETAAGITMIDQHAAHERIMYEQFKNNFTNIARAPLLFPQIITLSKEDVETLAPHLPLFEPLGLYIEPVSAQQLMIKETPLFLKNQPIDDIMHDMITCINQERITSSELRKLLQEKIQAQMSCKAAVKAGDVLSPESMHEIIKELLSCPNKTTCPHGRPTIWQLTEHEMKKKFKRDYRY